MAAEHVARIGANIRSAREAAKLTQRELADLIPGKADGNQVSKWERGEHRVSDTTLEHIAHALKVDVSRFLAPAPAEGTPDLMGALNGRGTQSQLDRIEERLDELVALVRDLGPSPAEVLEEPDHHDDEQPQHTAASAKRTRQKASGS